MSSLEQGMVAKSFAGLSRAIPLHMIHPVLDAKDYTTAGLSMIAHKTLWRRGKSLQVSSNSMDAHVVLKRLQLGRYIRLLLRMTHQNDHGHELHCLSVDNDRFSQYRHQYIVARTQPYDMMPASPSPSPMASPSIGL